MNGIYPDATDTDQPLKLKSSQRILNCIPLSIIRAESMDKRQKSTEMKARTCSVQGNNKLHAVARQHNEETRK